MRRVIVGFFAAVGFLTVLLVVGAVLLVGGLKPRVTPLADNIILSVDLTQGLAEGPSEDRLLRLLVGAEPTLRDVLDAIETASGDPRVKVLLARVGDDELGLGKVQELRDAIAAFRAKGKFALAFADSFGEFGPGTRPYYLATAFDEREEFKTAMNSLTETKMTPPHREEVDALLASISGQVIHGIAEDRKLPESAIRDAIDHGPLLADEARQAKLVDRLGYRDEAIAYARSRAGVGADLTSLTTYLDRAGRPHREGATVALIYGLGLIQRAASSANPLTGTNVMAANKIGRAFRAAVRDPAVRAIIFRIDSPGGSVVASESIWREVVRARERGKPVIVSMGDVAGSGGYYVAAPADKIVAEPATLTGSIGVLAGKLVVSDLLQKLGLSTDSAQIGANAAMFSSTSDFSARAHSRLEAFLDETYRGFKDHVASGRQMTQEAVEAVAKGRIWSGEDAKARGLIDELGGSAAALRLAKAAAKLAPDAAVKLTVFPREKEPYEIVFDRLLGKHRDDDERSAGSIERSLRAAQPLIQRLHALIDNSAVLTLPALGPIR